MLVFVFFLSIRVSFLLVGADRMPRRFASKWAFLVQYLCWYRICVAWDYRSDPEAACNQHQTGESSMLIPIGSMIKRTTSGFSESNRKQIKTCNSKLLMWLLRLVVKCCPRQSTFVTECQAKQQEMGTDVPLMSNVSAGKRKQGWIQINPIWRNPGRELELMVTWFFCMPC